MSVSRRPFGPWEALLGLLLRGLVTGSLEVTMPDGSELRFEGKTPGPVAKMIVRDDALSRRLLLGRDMALAESYIGGGWYTPDLDAVLELGLANLSTGWLDRLPDLKRPFHLLAHRGRDNDPEGGSRRNIAEHYDLGNEFYRLWLDETMTYSAALFDREPAASDAPDDELSRAQIRKWERLLELLQPGSKDHILEIGCGWGGFATYAAQQSGCHVTGLTLSTAQAAWAARRAAEAGLDGKVTVRLEDYRDAPGEYTGIASIEMFEAVGERWWPTFFRRLRELLCPGGAVALQSITISDDAFDAYRRDPDFIQRYVFPGGMLPSAQRFISCARTQGLMVDEPAFFGADYAQTLTEWGRRFEAAVPQVLALGFDERFVRLWRYYLAYCKAGFQSENIDVMQVRLAR